MGIAVRNSAFSPNIKERLDHSCALFDRSGVSSRKPNTSPFTSARCRGDCGACWRSSRREHGGMREGDMWFANDPYVTGTHLNDVTRRPPGLLPRHACRIRGEQSASRRRRRYRSRARCRSMRRISLTRASSCRRCVLMRDDRDSQRNRRALPRQLPHAGRAKRGSSRADRRQLHRRAPTTRVVQPLRLRVARSSIAARYRRQRTPDAQRRLRTLGDGDLRERPIIWRTAMANRRIRIALR